MARDVAPIEGQNCGIASQPSQSRHPHCIVVRKLFIERAFHLSLLIMNLKSLYTILDNGKRGSIVSLDQVIFTYCSPYFTLLATIKLLPRDKAKNFHSFRL